MAAETSTSDSTILPAWLQASLTQTLAQQRGHAVLVQSAPGMGGHGFAWALALAKAWLCETPFAARIQKLACGHCASCALMTSQTHPDLFVLLSPFKAVALKWGAGIEAENDAKDAKKLSQDIKIDALRSAIAFMQQTSARGQAKVVLIHPAERMNEVAANTLLKTLEEPPGQAKFLLSSEAPYGLLPTLKSRCQMLKLMAPPTPAQQLHANTWLEDASITVEQWSALPQALAESRLTELARWPLPALVEALQKLCHDVLRVHFGQSPQFFFPDSWLMKAQSASLPQLLAWGKTLNQQAKHAYHPWGASLMLETLVVQAQRAYFNLNVQFTRNPL